MLNAGRAGLRCGRLTRRRTASAIVTAPPLHVITTRWGAIWIATADARSAVVREFDHVAASVSAARRSRSRGIRRGHAADHDHTLPIASEPRLLSSAAVSVTRRQHMNLRWKISPSTSLTSSSGADAAVGRRLQPPVRPGAQVAEQRGHHFHNDWMTHTEAPGRSGLPSVRATQLGLDHGRRYIRCPSGRTSRVCARRSRRPIPAGATLSPKTERGRCPSPKNAASTGVTPPGPVEGRQQLPSLTGRRRRMPTSTTPPFPRWPASSGFQARASRRSRTLPMSASTVSEQ